VSTKRPKTGKGKAAPPQVPTRPAHLPPVGHDDIVARLRAVAESVQGGGLTAMHHAYVFAGPDGIGKFTTAFWWTRRMKCEQGGDCGGACASCRQIAGGAHPDVVILEPEERGKKIGIAPVREIIRKMSLRPQRPGPRVTLIRDADLLTIEGQNAMLKLLEEPPGTAVIVLIATAPGALLATVRSRCQILRFGLLDEAALRTILADSGVGKDEAGARATVAGGSAERALALTPEALSEREELIEVFESIRGERYADIESFTQRLADKDSGREERLWTLFAWQMSKVRSGLADGSDEPSQRRKLLREADRIAETIRMIRANVNAKLAIRDLLIDIRG